MSYRMIRRFSPSVLFAVFLAAVTLLALASGRDGVQPTVERFSDRVAGVVALATEDARAAPKCGKTGYSGTQTQAPGVLASVPDPCVPRLAVRYARPGELTRPHGLAPMPELSPPKAVRTV